MVCQCSDYYWSVMFGWYELDVARGGSQCDSSSAVFIPLVIGSGIYRCIVSIYICIPCAFATVGGMPVTQFSF